MGDSDEDEEERLRRWKQHLAAQQTDDEEEGPPPAELLSMRRQPSDRLVGAVSMVMAEKRELQSEGHSQKIDWVAAMMPEMRQQIHDLQRDKEQLEARLQASEQLAARLKRELTEDSRDNSADPTDLKEAKIVELAKRNRTLTLALDKEKAKSGRLTADVRRLQAELDAGKRGRDQMVGMDARSVPRETQAGTKGGKSSWGALAFGQRVPDTSAEPDEQTPEDHLRNVTQKLAGLHTVVNTQRMANERLKQENNKVKEALKRELGDVTLDTALRAVEGNGGGWTGRAQTISLLQSKVVELKRELALSNQKISAAQDSTNGEDGEGGNSTTKPSLPLDAASRIDAQHRRELDRIEKDKRMELCSLQEEAERARAEKKDVQRKLTAASSRVSVLKKRHVAH